MALQRISELDLQIDQAIKAIRREICLAAEIREKGDLQTAIKTLTSITTSGTDLGMNDQVRAHAISELIVCNKHAYKDPENDEQMRARALINMRRLAESGLEFTYVARLRRPAHGLQGAAATFFYRLGDVEFLRGDYPNAISYLTKSCQYTSDTELSYPEHHSYLGLALAMTGKEAGLDNIKRAYKAYKKLGSRYRKSTPWQPLIIECGIYLRRAEAANHLGMRELAQKSLSTARQIAEVLEKKYKMRRRMDDVQELARRFPKAKQTAA